MAQSLKIIEMNGVISIDITDIFDSDEIAELAFYLMSNYGEIICGHTVVADGGDNCATL